MKDKLTKSLNFLYESDGTAQDVEDSLFWDALEQEQAKKASSDYQIELASYLSELGCEAEGAPFVAKGLIVNGLIDLTGNQAGKIEANWFDGDHPKCAGVQGMTKPYKEALHWLVGNAEP